MERPVEVAVLDRGKLETVRLLSPRRERLSAALGGVAGAGLVFGGMTLAMGWLQTVDRVVHAPTFFGFWALVGAVVATFGARWARARASRYRVGVDIEADAFAPAELDLVRRSGDDYDLGLVPGMTGVLESGRAPVPIEALTARGALRVPLPPNALVRVELGATTFVIGRRAEDRVVLPAVLSRLAEAGRSGARRLVRVAGVGVFAASSVTALIAVPQVSALSEAAIGRIAPAIEDGRRFIPVRLLGLDEVDELSGRRRGTGLPLAGPRPLCGLALALPTPEPLRAVVPVQQARAGARHVVFSEAELVTAPAAY